LSCWALLEMFSMASVRRPAGILLTLVHGKRLVWVFRSRKALKSLPSGPLRSRMLHQ